MKMKFPILTYTAKSIKFHRKTMLLNIFCMTFFIFCMCSLVIMIQSLNYSNAQYAKKMYGLQDVVFQDADNTLLTDIRENRYVKDIGVASSIGFKDIQGLSYKDAIIFGSIDNSVRTQGQLRLVSGSWPAKNNEIVLEESLYYKLRLNVAVGENISFSMELWDGNLTDQDFQLVGICNDYSNLHAGTNNNTETRLRLPNAVIGSTDSFRNVIRHAYATLYDRSEVTAFLSSVKLGDDCFAHINSRDVIDTNSYIRILLTIILTAFIVMGIFGVYTNITIIKKSRMKRIYDFKVIGLSHNNIIKQIILEMIICFMIALPLGVFFGIAVSYAVVKGLIISYVPYFQYILPLVPVLLISLISSLLILTAHTLPFMKYLQMKPGEILQVKEVGSNFRKSLPIRSSINLWGIKSFIINVSVYSKIIISFSLLFAVSILSAYITNAAFQTLERKIVADYHINQYGGSNFTLLDIPLNIENGISNMDVERFREDDEVASCIGIKYVPFKLLESKKENVDKHPFSRLDKRGFDIEDYEKDLTQNGYSLEETLYSCYLTGVEDSLFLKLTPYVINGNIDIQDIRQNKKIVIVLSEEVSDYEIGETLQFTQSFFKENHNTPYRFDIQASIAAVVQIPENAFGLREMIVNNTVDILVHNEFLEDLPQKTNFNQSFINLKDAKVFENTEAILKGIQSVYSDSIITSQRQQTQEQQFIILSIRLTFSVIIITIFSFSLLTFGVMMQTIIIAADGCGGRCARLVRC